MKAKPASFPHWPNAREWRRDASPSLPCARGCVPIGPSGGARLLLLLFPLPPLPRFGHFFLLQRRFPAESRRPRVEAAAPFLPLGRPHPGLLLRRRHAGADRQRGPHQVRLGDRGGAAAGRAAAALPGHGQYVRGARPEAFPLAPLDPCAFSPPHPDGLDGRAWAGSSR